MNILEIMKLWTLSTMLKAIEQTKEASTFVYDRYFKTKAEGILGQTAELKIKKGAGIVLKTIAPGADRLVKDMGDVFLLTIKLPRFGLSDQILAHEINEFESLEGKAKVESVSQKIAKILKEHKNDYMTTIEYMCTGALFGRVVDGEGKILLEFNTTAPKVEFKNKEITKVLNEIDDALVDELGKEVPYEVLASRTFLNRLAAKALAADLFKSNEAKWVKQADNKRVLEIQGTTFIPYNPSFKDENGNKKQYILDGEAIVIPTSEDVFHFIYGRADHTEALKSAPKLFFAAAPEKLGKGKGWGIETETKPLPYCVRPGALIKLKFSA
ncbi:major capsid protein [Sulfurimonas sp.]|uniref:major capsid protein n=1 Tax=Sulfurimonas sp. TaxID=2022749 RepID=UPI0025DC6594|nr:major capsid protein [Sulfurimonas sp.]